MLPQRYRPAAPLDRFVDCLWYFEQLAAPHQRERALPTGTVELVFDLREDSSVVCGAHAGYFVLDTSRPVTVVGVHFHPGGAAPFLGAPAHEFTDRDWSLEDIWGRAAAQQLRSRLLEAASPPAMFALLEAALLARMHRPLMPQPAVLHALRRFTEAPALARIGAVSEETGYSHRSFIERFRASVGLTPKVYCRIRRFQAVIDRLALGRPVEWAAVALDGGYSDQPHLNREFRAFSGVTPAAYRPVDPGRPNHVAIEG